MKIGRFGLRLFGLAGSGRGAGTRVRCGAGGWSSAAASARGSVGSQEEPMRPHFSIRHGTAPLLALLLAAAPGATRTEAQGAGEAQVRTELDLLKEQLRRVEQPPKLQEGFLR